MQYTGVLSFGDSFTWGTDLKDCDSTRCSQSSWPAVLAQQQNLDYQCHATGGIGNQQIACRVVQRYSTHPKKERNFYIVNWTWIERFDYVDPAQDSWSVVHPRHDDTLSHFFYRNIDSQAWNMIRNLQTIWFTISFLKEHRCRFLMTMLDDTVWSEQYPVRYVPMISPLQNLVRPYMSDFDGENFLDWSNNQGFARGATDHPLEHAHNAAATVIYPEFQRKSV